jgi:hypothetical protein
VHTPTPTPTPHNVPTGLPQHHLLLLLPTLLLLVLSWLLALVAFARRPARG